MMWRVVILLIAGVLDIALFGKMLWGSGGILEYTELKRQYGELREHIADLDAQNLALSHDIRLLQSDDQYMEKMVRQKLRYLRDNEIVYLFPAQSETRYGAMQHDSKN